MNFMQRLQRFMYGRYGGDGLNLALLLAGVIWSIVWRFTPLPMLGLLSYVFLGLAVFRMLSRNVVKRSREYQVFLKLTAPVRGWLRTVTARLKDQEHRYFSCPGCGQTCRVPRGRGKINIRCPKCNTSFVKKS